MKVGLSIDRTGRIPMLKLRDRESYVRNKTKEYDDIAMKYLCYVLFLLVAGFSVYSLMYERHKSWYSWILSSLTSCVYMFDLIFLIYLYQRWIYPVDKKRVNEFGFGGEDDQAVAETDAAKEEEKKTN
ncbi:hypothetical protein V8G54_007344 [Vigna mungo]|uniref:Uncharacterized protein n=1 Tax=Vigna mungo TaxID=3915 RepID=A0AAQ3P3M6_VIGMU